MRNRFARVFDYARIAEAPAEEVAEEVAAAPGAVIGLGSAVVGTAISLPLYLIKARQQRLQAILNAKTYAELGARIGHKNIEPSNILNNIDQPNMSREEVLASGTSSPNPQQYYASPEEKSTAEQQYVEAGAQYSPTQHSSLSREYVLGGAMIGAAAVAKGLQSAVSSQKDDKPDLTKAATNTPDGPQSSPENLAVKIHAGSTHTVKHITEDPSEAQAAPPVVNRGAAPHPKMDYSDSDYQMSQTSLLVGAVALLVAGVYIGNSM